MNAELKFRAFDKLQKKYIVTGFHILGETSCFNIIGMELIGFTPELSTLERLKDVVIEQFTGLQDKNSIEIYEGDVLEFKNGMGRHRLHRVFRTKGGLAINCHNDDFYKEKILFYDGCSDMQTSQWIEQCEVVGNVHENPELLNK